MVHYFKFRVPFKGIHSILQQGQYSKIIFYIDLPSIARGFYNADVVHLEIDQYIETHKMPELFFQEARTFYDQLLDQFKQYNPFFVTFYDSGKCSQNRTINSSYKGDRGSTIDNLLLEDEYKELFRNIKNYYFMEFINRFNIPGLSAVVYSNDYEGDFIPHIIISHNWIQSQNPKTLNVILSTDKDLGQTCRYTNVRMCSTVYLRKEGKLEFYILDDANAISYIYKKFKRGLLTAEYIPLILAIAGDKADNISGVKGVGDATAIKLIIQYNLPPEITQSTPLPKKLDENRKLILDNFALTSFDEQMRRIPLTFFNKLSNQFQSLGG